MDIRRGGKKGDHNLVVVTSTTTTEGSTENVPLTLAGDEDQHRRVPGHIHQPQR
jgi:hypothetical protein